MTTARCRQRGMALLLVTWVFMTLGVLALDFSAYIRDDAMAVVNFSEEARGYYVALAGMNHVLYEAMLEREGALDEAVLDGRDEDDPDDAALGFEEKEPLADGAWHGGEFAGAAYEVRLTDEGGKLSLNRAPPALLKRVVQNLLVGPRSQVQGIDRRTGREVDEIVDAILDWRDVDDEKRLHGAESDYYERHGYQAKNGWFSAPEELLLVRGITAELFFGTEGRPGLRDVVSVHNKTGTLNLRTAPAAVLQVLLGVDAETAAAMVEERTAGSGATLLQDAQAALQAVDPNLAEQLVDQPAQIVFVEARADVRAERNRAHIAAVVDLSGETAEGVRIIRWFDRAPWTGGLPPGPAEDA